MHDPFTWSFPMGRLGGIAVRIHFLLPLLFLGLILRTASAERGITGAWIDCLLYMVLLFVTILLHELGHCYACRFVGGEASQVLLWPLGGLARADLLPYHPRAYFWFAAGGPIVNVLICLVAAAGLALLGDQPLQPRWNPLDYVFRINSAGEINLFVWGAGDKIETASFLLKALAFWFHGSWILLLFNVLCIGFPFDGGQMFRALLWPYLGFRQATEYAIFSGFFVMMILLLFAFISTELGVFLLLLAYFTYASCKAEWIALETGGEDSLFGYDFSQGYTSLEKDQPPPTKKKSPGFFQRWLQQRADRKRQKETQQQEADEKRMDELLEKIQRQGKGSLTAEEQRFLKRVSDRYRNRP